MLVTRADMAIRQFCLNKKDRFVSRFPRFSRFAETVFTALAIAVVVVFVLGVFLLIGLHYWTAGTADR